MSNYPKFFSHQLKEIDARLLEDGFRNIAQCLENGQYKINMFKETFPNSFPREEMFILGSDVCIHGV